MPIRAAMPMPALSLARAGIAAMRPAKPAGTAIGSEELRATALSIDVSKSVGEVLPNDSDYSKPGVLAMRRTARQRRVSSRLPTRRHSLRLPPWHAERRRHGDAQ